MVLGHSEVGEKLQRVACGEVVDRKLCRRKTVVKFLNCLKLTIIFSCLLIYSPREGGVTWRLTISPTGYRLDHENHLMIFFFVFPKQN